MWDAPMEEDSGYADYQGEASWGSEGAGNYAGSSLGKGDNGTGSKDGSSAPIAGWIAQGFSNSLAVYGAWAEGEQLWDYYQKQMQLTYLEKQQFIRRTELQVADVKMAARDAETEADYSRKMGDIKEKRYKDQTDGAIGAIMARGAKSGVDMSYGSPLEYMSKMIDERAEDFGVMQWENKYSAYKREREIANLNNKATIMLSEQKMQEKMFDYQRTMFERASGDARTMARNKSTQAGLNI